MNQPQYGPAQAPPPGGYPPPPPGGYPPPPGYYPPPTPGGYPPPPGYYPPPTPSKKSHKFRNFVVLPFLGLIVLIVVVVSTSSGSKSNSPGSGTSPTPGVSNGLGAKGASADVAVGAIAVDPTLDYPSVPVTVTNHSSKRSNYLIELSLESGDGATQIDSALVSVENLEAGQVTNQTGQFTTSAKLPAGAKVTVKSVTRFASN